jgi:hypothetical protein
MRQGDLTLCSVHMRILLNDCQANPLGTLANMKLRVYTLTSYNFRPAYRIEKSR